MTQHGEREDIEWYPEEVFVGRFARDGMGLSSDADDFDPDSLTEPCMSYTRDDRVAALRAENERLREAALHLLETVHRPDLTKTEKVEATKRQLEARFLAGAASGGRTDRERLDWVEEVLLRDVSLCSHMTAQGGISYSIGGDGIRFPSIRAAIDAAMHREGQGDAA